MDGNKVNVSSAHEQTWQGGAAQEEQKELGYLGPSPKSLTQSHGADGAEMDGHGTHLSS